MCQVVQVSVENRIEEIQRGIQNVTVQDADHSSSASQWVCSPLEVVDLSCDAWLLVFSYLDVAWDRMEIPNVCRRWRQLAQISGKAITSLSFGRLFKRPLVSGAGGRTDNHAVQACLQQCGQRLKCLEFVNFDILFTPALVAVVMQRTASLLKLDLSCTHLDNLSLTTILKESPRLTTLELTRCKGINEGALRDAFGRMPLLQFLNLSQNDWLTGKAFSRAPRSLREVCIRWCRSLTDEGIRVLTERCADLESIDVASSGSDTLTTQTITDTIAKNCPKLKKLDCSSSAILITKSALLALCSLPLLQEVYMGPACHSDASDREVCEVAKHCPHITAFKLWHCPFLTHVGVGHLVSACPHLRFLSVLDCTRVNGEVVLVLEGSLQYRQPLWPLVVELSGTGVTPEDAGKLQENSEFIVTYDDSKHEYFSPE